jgi:hypothetical protein
VLCGRNGDALVSFPLIGALRRITPRTAFKEPLTTARASSLISGFSGELWGFATS